MFNLSLPITLSVNVLNVLFWVLAVAPSIVITCLITNKNRHLYFNVIAVFLCGAAAVFAAGFAVSAGDTSAEGPVVAFFLEDIIECS